MLLDIIFLAIIIACVIWGAKRGIIKTVLGLSSFVVSIIAALLLYQPFMDGICSNPAIASVIDGFKDNIAQAIMPSQKVATELLTACQDSAPGGRREEVESSIFRSDIT